MSVGQTSYSANSWRSYLPGKATQLVDNFSGSIAGRLAYCFAMGFRRHVRHSAESGNDSGFAYQLSGTWVPQ